MVERVISSVDVRPQSPLGALAPGSIEVLRSSAPLRWQGILLETHLHSPGERTSATYDKHVVSIFSGLPSRFEYRRFSGEFVPVLARPKTLMITPAGPLPDLRLHTPAELTHCAFEDGFIRGVINELDHPVFRPIFQPAIQDKSIGRILGMLMDELEAEQPSARLYVDSLAHALATRYVLLDKGRMAGKIRSRVTGLLPRILSRVRDKIEANLDADLSLESLAEESGYSRAHFLRMFQAATGFTPHQYVLDLRLRRAQERLRQSGASIIDVAASCGFSSQSHMTSVFRRRLEMTPGEFRRNAYF